VSARTPPDLPGGRAAGSRKFFRGFWGRSGENSAGEPEDWYFARGVVDMRVETPGSLRQGWG